ncbi:MAG: methionyl-tRNA formyltransferase [Lachnospiraceae bacterium]|nr:methionyl-tRNA formyltransferase [Lachnospiraceae bacterium]
MARINKLQRIEKNRNSIHNISQATYSVFTLGGNKYFQIDTYGSNFRENPGVCSQSIQLNKETAMELKELLKKEFGI